MTGLSFQDSPEEAKRGWARHPHALALFTPSPGDRLRLLVNYKGFWRGLLWVKVARDGSIYLAPRITNVLSVKSGTKMPVDGSVTINYDEGDSVVDTETLRNPKVSFHASGLIRIGGERLLGPSLRSLDSDRMLCQILFEHPSKRKPFEKLEKRDICLEYPIDEERPLICGVFVAPSKGFNPAVVENATHCAIAGLLYQGLTDVPDLMLQLALWHGPLGDWPPETYVTLGYQEEAKGTGDSPPASSE